MLAWLCAGAAAAAETSPAPDLGLALKAARHPLTLDERGLSGEGARLIRERFCGMTKSLTAVRTELPLPDGLPASPVR